MTDSTALSHLDEHGQTRMVDVGQKPETERVAIARAEVHMRPETLALIRTDELADLACGTVAIILYPFIDIINRETGHKESYDTGRTEYNPQCSYKYLDNRWPSL